MLLTVSTEASSMCGPLKSGRQSHYYSKFWPDHANYLVICKNSELMAGSQYPQTTRSLPKQGFYLIIMLFCFCSVEKNRHINRRWINPFPQFLASHTLKINSVLIKFNSGHARKLKLVEKTVSVPSQEPSGFLNPDEEQTYRHSGRRVKSSRCPSEFLGIAP